MHRRTSRALAALAVGLTGLLALSGCGFTGIYSLPLPGGPNPSNPYQVVAEFQDVTNLVPQSAVKVNNVAVGSVTDIEPAGQRGDWRARVTMQISGDVALPDNAVAKISQTSVLGAKYVALSRPVNEPPRGRLTDGEVIPVARTGSFPEVETVLTALSMLLNRGGLAQIETITSELNAALEGNETAVRNLLSDLNTFVGKLEAQKDEIVAALQGLDRLSTRLAEQKQILADAIDRLPRALRILNAQQEDLTRLLVALSDFGEVATRVINQSREDVLANLRALQPVLARLADAGEDIPKTLGILVNFPFPDSAPNAIYGDYVNLDVTVDTTFATLVNNLLPGPAGNGPLGQLFPPGGSRPGPGAAQPRLPQTPDVPLPGPSAPSAPGVPSVPAQPDTPAPTDAPDPQLPDPQQIPDPPGGQPSQSRGDGGLLDLLQGGMR